MKEEKSESPSMKYENPRIYRCAYADLYGVAGLTQVEFGYIILGFICCLTSEIRSVVLEASIGLLKFFDQL